MTSTRRLILTMVAAIVIVVATAGEVLAIIGRPATPVSYAGVARRTVRRTVP